MYKISNIIPIHPVAAELFHANEQTDMTKLTVDFRNSEKAPKINLHSSCFPKHSQFTARSPACPPPLHAKQKLCCVIQNDTTTVHLTCLEGCAMALMVSRRLLTAESRVQCQVSPCEICSGQSGSPIRIFLSISVLPYQYHSENAPYTSSPTCSSQQKGKWAKPGNLSNKSSASSEINTP